MPTAFAITAATTTVRLDASRVGEAQFTVTNTSGRPLRARLRAVALQPDAAGWFTVAGEAERPFTLGETQQVAVRLAAPPPAPAGTYAVRLDAAAEDNPDDDSVQGPSVTIEIPAPPAKKPFPWWIVAVAVAVLLIGGAAAFFFLSGDDAIKVPDVAGQPVLTAQANILTEGLTAGNVTQEANATIPPDAVIRTDPAANETVDKGDTVHVVVSLGPPVTLPGIGAVYGQSFEQVKQSIEATCSSVPALCPIVQSNPWIIPDLPVGQVLTTNPLPGSQVQPGSTVEVYVSTERFNRDAVDPQVIQDADRAFLDTCGLGIDEACGAIMPTETP